MVIGENPTTFRTWKSLWLSVYSSLCWSWFSIFMFPLTNVVSSSFKKKKKKRKKDYILLCHNLPRSSRENVIGPCKNEIITVYNVG